jgi:hypothetical protein
LQKVAELNTEVKKQTVGTVETAPNSSQDTHVSDPQAEDEKNVDSDSDYEDWLRGKPEIKSKPAVKKSTLTQPSTEPPPKVKQAAPKFSQHPSLASTQVVPPSLGRRSSRSLSLTRMMSDRQRGLL